MINNNGLGLIFQLMSSCLLTNQFFLEYVLLFMYVTKMINIFSSAYKLFKTNSDCEGKSKI